LKPKQGSVKLSVDEAKLDKKQENYTIK